MEKQAIINDYFRLAETTCRKSSSLKEHVVHMALGLSSEYYEYMEADLKSHEEHIVEELGDMFWYAANMCRSVFINSLSDILSSDKKRDPITLEKAIGDFVSEAKRIYVYNKEIDENLLADLCFSIVTALIQEVNYIKTHFATITLENILQANVDKLIKRYPDGFTETAAIERADKSE